MINYSCLEFKKTKKKKRQGTNTVIDRMVAQCDSGSDGFGDMLLDYQKIDLNELICYMNMALCGTSNIRVYEKNGL